MEEPKGPIGLCDVGRVIHHALLLDPALRTRLEGPVLAVVGRAREPQQIGLFDEKGLHKYDFVGGAWTRETHSGAAPGRWTRTPP